MTAPGGTGNGPGTVRLDDGVLDLADDAGAQRVRAGGANSCCRYTKTVPQQPPGSKRPKTHRQGNAELPLRVIHAAHSVSLLDHIRGGRTVTALLDSAAQEVPLRICNPISWLERWADWFERRGVYVPGEGSRAVDPWRDFGWLIVAWVAGLALFILFFAIAVQN